MKTIIAIGGEPATGKTTLMTGLMLKIDNALGKNRYEKVSDLIYAHIWKIVDTDYIYVLGQYSKEKMFSGTDTLSMAVQPNVLPWLDSLEEGAVVIMEGDRLFNQSFLESIAELGASYDLHAYILEADQNTLVQRHVDRKDTQDDKFLKGRKTKYSNIAMNMMLQSVIETRKNNTPEEAIKTMETIYKFVDDCINDEIPF